jgi:pimeloyl-ACP methyl ester carboxylesterase
MSCPVIAPPDASSRRPGSAVSCASREDGEPVLCMHGVPASSFVYRKVIAELAGRGLRSVAFDLPGLGLAARPEQFDYSWTGLGKFSAAASFPREAGQRSEAA